MRKLLLVDTDTIDRIVDDCSYEMTDGETMVNVEELLARLRGQFEQPVPAELADLDAYSGFVIDLPPASNRAFVETLNREMEKAEAENDAERVAGLIAERVGPPPGPMQVNIPGESPREAGARLAREHATQDLADVDPATPPGTGIEDWSAVQGPEPFSDIDSRNFHVGRVIDI